MRSYAWSLLLASIVAAAASTSAQDQTTSPAGQARIIVGTDSSGRSHHQPADWPGPAGPWNGKGARFCPQNRQLVFETYRMDIAGGSIEPSSGTIRAPGVTYYYLAGPETGSVERSGTTVIYVSRKDGGDARCIGCTDIHDGQDGAEIYLADPSSSDKPSPPSRQHGAVLFANQNKDLPAWHPSGAWIIAGVEMKQHALKHSTGCSEKGMFNNLWAISADGLTWVQLTNYEKTWYCYDPLALVPYASTDSWNCRQSAQYASAQFPHPYMAYSGCAQSDPPPASGTMRPTVGNVERSGRVPIIWAERVGLHPKYAWGGVLQLATAEVVLQNGLPTLINYRRNLAPTPLHPGGVGANGRLWSNPGGDTLIGAGYEPWTFSKDDSEILMASDVFLSHSGSDGPEPGPGRDRPGCGDEAQGWPWQRKTNTWTQGFTDVIAWKWRPPASLCDLTAYDDRVYAYEDNGGPGEVRRYGHWEEPAVYVPGERGSDLVAFASSANLTPPWNPMDHLRTFGLDVWIVRRDQTRPARRVTFFNRQDSGRFMAYPTAVDPQDHTLFLTLAPGGQPGANPPGAIYMMTVTEP